VRQQSGMRRSHRVIEGKSSEYSQVHCY
jgi:hypothetical protein